MEIIHINKDIVVPEGKYCNEKLCNFHDSDYRRLRVCTIFDQRVLKQNRNGNWEKCEL